MKLEKSDGNSVSVEKEPIAKGGEGSVHKILAPSNYSDFCVKLYYPKQLSNKRKQKIMYMIKNPPLNLKGTNHIICWPKEILFKKGKFVGFLMPLAFSGSIELYQLCGNKIKTKLGKNWALKFERSTRRGIKSRLMLCTNLAGAIHNIHSHKKYVMVDLKPQNVLVTDEGKVSVIDCDSIQISEDGRVLYPAQVATPEYVPPEGEQINPSKMKVPESWDRFSMAIMFYELIFGIHPYTATFSGKYQESVTIDSKIKSGLFVHGVQKNQVTVLPPPHKNFGILPASLKGLFIRAFDKGNKMPDVRPTAEEWGQVIYKEVKSKKTLTRKSIPHSPNRTLHKKQIALNASTKPIKKDQGIGLMCLLYGIIPVIGFIVMLDHYYKGETHKGNQSLLSWLIGSIILLALYVG